jgi:hypothetical protein
MDKKTLEQYLKVKTAQDLMDLGVIPKDSANSLALITHERLVALRDKISAGLDEKVLGKWVPLINEKLVNVGKTEITDPVDIARYGAEGMVVSMLTRFGDTGPITEREGKIILYKNKRSKVGVEFVEDIGSNETFDGRCKRGHGCYIKATDIKKLKIPNGKVHEGYVLRDRAVADEKTGSRVIFRESFKGQVAREGRYNDELEVGRGTRGMLVGFDEKNETISIAPEGEAGKKLKYFTMGLDDALDVLDVSTLGQIYPQDKEEMTMKRTLEEFFSKTKLDNERAERAVIGLLMPNCNHMVFYGPPGSGKSSILADIKDIAKQQKILFHVKGCKVQCNPFSLTDYNGFGKIVPPCPECMIKYSKGNGFKETGIFNIPDPKDIPVTVAEFSQGKGIEMLQGRRKLTTMHLTGMKIPKLDGPSDENEFDPEGFHPGSFPRANNGLLAFEEMDKAVNVLDDILDMISSGAAKAEQLRFTYPSNCVIIGTANDPSVFAGPLNDRMFLLAIRYPDEVDTNSRITQAGYHKIFTPVESVPIEDIHTKERLDIREEIPMPMPVEKAVEAAYVKFRNEYSGKGKSEISGSNRSKFDALDVARVELMMHGLFYKDTPKIAGPEYAIKGVQFALCARVSERDKKISQECKTDLRKWVEDNFAAFVKEEENNWWCEAYRQLGNAKMVVPEIEENFFQELKMYAENPETIDQSFEAVKAAYDDKKGDKKIQMAKIQSPLMDYLFLEQPRMAGLGGQALIEMVQYYVKSEKNCDAHRVGDKGK